MRLTTTVSSFPAGVLRNPMEIENPRVSLPTSSIGKISHSQYAELSHRSSSTTTVSVVVTNSSHEEMDTAVLSVPINHTTPMTVMNPSSSHIIDNRSSKYDEPKHLGYVLAPVILLLCLAIISGIVFFCIQRRKKLDALRHRLIPVYHFAPGEEDEWGVLLDNQEQGHNPPR